MAVNANNPGDDNSSSDEEVPGHGKQGLVNVIGRFKRGEYLYSLLLIIMI